MISILKKFKKKKAPGEDNIPIEFWAYIVGHEEARAILLDFLNDCWAQKRVPVKWRHALVVALFKKGSIELPENYHPISLLDVGYKIMAAIILQRLQTGGAEERIRESQYRFRPKRSSSDAFFLARRIIDDTLSIKDQKLFMIALDWEKAFDRINSQALMIALSRPCLSACYN